ncbi:MAG: hypothetical protein WA740_09550 [Candidatus Binataceae bacterium]
MPTHRDENIAHKPTRKTHKTSVKGSVWEAFCNDTALLRLRNIQPHEIETLSHVAMLGSVRSKSDLIFMLNAIRRARRASNQQIVADASGISG